jgi:mRNA interferase HigB
MHIISKKALREFWQRHQQAEPPLRNWYLRTRRAQWKNLTDARQDFPHADTVGLCTIFNIGGNNYRIISKIFYDDKVVLVRSVLTHADYDKEKWKDDCGI